MEIEIEIEKLSSPAALQAAEDLSDKLQANISIAEALAGGVSLHSGRRKKDQATVQSTRVGLIYASQHDYVRKVYISNTQGACVVELYDSREDYIRNGSAGAFTVREIVGSADVVVYSPNSGSRTIYTRISVTEVPNTVYYHVEWVE